MPNLSGAGALKLKIMYYISCKVFSIGSGQTESFYDDNKGKGYTIDEAKKKQKELDTYTSVEDPPHSNNWYAEGVEAKIYSFDGELVS